MFFVILYLEYNQEITVKNLLNLSMILLLTSCAAWRLQKTEIIENYSKEIKEEKHKTKVFLSVDKVTHYLNGEKISEKTDASETDKTLQTIKQAYVESGLFEFVAKDKSEMQINIDVDVHGKSTMAMTVLTAATLFLFPSKTTDDFTIKAKFTKNGDELGVIEKFETVAMYRQIFLIFAMPFKAPFNINNKVLVDLNRSVITEAYDEGYFKEIKDVDLESEGT